MGQRAYCRFLEKLPDSEPFIPAAVTALGKNGAELLLANNETMTLSSNAMRWAGKSPVKVGEQIWIRKRDNGEWVLGQIPAANSALVSLNSDNGAIEAMVGGFSYEQVNLTVQPIFSASRFLRLNHLFMLRH